MKSSESLILLRAEVFGTLFALAQQIDVRAEAELKSLGVTTKQWLFLALMEKGLPGGSPTLSEAARIYGCSRQNAKQIALQLQARGFLRIKRDPDDARTLRLELTEKIREFKKPAQEARQIRFLAKTFEVFSEKELRTLRDLLVRWIRSYSEEVK